MGRKPKAQRDAYGEWLLYLRTKRGMTQQEVKSLLSEQTGWSQHQAILSYWETTGKIPGRDIILGLAEIYDCSLETLLGVQKINGKFVKRDDLIKQATRENEQRRKMIKEKNTDPNL